MEEVSFIKNDTSLVSGESSLQVVTGPNMGGKSTYIRAVGVNVLLAQAGQGAVAEGGRGGSTGVGVDGGRRSRAPSRLAHLAQVGCVALLP